MRQDVLGIQMLRMIDSIWKQGWTGPQANKDYILDMNLTPYDVLSTPKYNPNELDEKAFREFGFIQKINGRTLSDIQANQQVTVFIILDMSHYHRYESYRMSVQTVQTWLDV